MSTEGSGETVLPPLNMVPEQTYLFPKAKGHARSISHGGTPTLVPNPIGRPSALKSAHRGHQRAFSQGQIGDSGPQSGHSRTGSRTDFILPPGHRDTPNLPIGVPRATVHGHSRQASRSESIYTIRRNSEASQWLRAMLWMLRRKPPAVDTNHIVVVPNHTIPVKTPQKEHPNGHRCDNKVITTKYTLLSFLPKNLLEQFHRIANLYFIFIVLLNWFPSINAFGKEVAMIPVLFVLGVTAIKDLFEDRRRHQSDNRINNSYCRVYKKAVDRYMRVRWAEVRAGDLVHLSNNEPVPADLVLLRSSDSAGVAYLDTGNLDGETNLKPRHVATGFREKHLTFSAGKFKSRVEVDQPSTKIYRFHGTIVHPNEERVPLSSENLLLRDCFVKNTDYVEGIVVYAGHETKAMLNNGGPRYKRSALERSMNTDIIWCVLVLLLLCFIGAVGSKLWLDRYVQMGYSKVPFILPSLKLPFFEAVINFWTFIIILQVMIPISLYVTIEMTKLLQVYHIHHNVDMYDPTTDTRVQCRALNITEELGQVQYLFSDKTGTLTENKMVFRRCTIGGFDYDHPEDGSPAGRPERRDSWPGPLDPVVTPITKVTPNQQLAEQLKRGGRVREFLLVLAICNTVVVSYHPHIDGMNDSGIVREPPVTVSDPKITNGGEPAASRSAEKYARLAESRSTTPSPPLPSLTVCGSSRGRFPRLPTIPFIGRDRVSQLPEPPTPTKSIEDTPKVHYEAESPDELALTEAALAYGVELRRRGPEEVELAVLGERTVVSVLRVQTFDAARKCMSVAVRGPDGQVVLYVKGADSSVLGALAPVREGSAESAALSRTRSQLDAYARRGLRTLAVARRTLSARQWEEWCAEHARSSLAGPGRERRVRESLARLESGLSLLGGTGVEDRLQEDVPRTVRAMLDAGIVIWVLTGDKPETAVNIAYSANLFSQQDELMHLMARSKDQAEATINCYLQSMENGGSRWDAPANSLLMQGVGRQRGRLRPSGRALVVDGKTLTYILDRRSGLVAPFLALTKRCSSVLCCRATPLQKAYIVKAVKEELGVRTLAIGDGANDVSMIQTADVGIGLSGQEGRQAVMASDFALSRFKYLERLLLVHGHWSYDRLARMILYFFLKNATFVFIVFWFQFYCGFSASVMIDQLHLMAYNLIFTALPPIAIGAYDRLAPESLLLERPGLYKGSRLGRAYRPYSYWLILLESVYISLVIFFFSVYTYWGDDVDIWQFGLVNTTSCLIVMTLYVAIETRSWTIIHLFALAGSVAAFFVSTLMYQSVSLTRFGLSSTYMIMHHALPDPRYWLLIVLITTASLAPRLAWRGLANTMWPDALGRAVLQRRAHKRRSRLPYAASYHNPTASTHIYRSTYQDSLSNHQSETSAVT